MVEWMTAAWEAGQLKETRLPPGLSCNRKCLDCVPGVHWRAARSPLAECELAEVSIVKPNTSAALAEPVEWQREEELLTHIQGVQSPRF